MARANILEQLGQKGIDIEAIVHRIIKKSKEISELVEALKVEKSAVKFKSVFKKEVEKENGRKVRRSYCFSKDWDIHNAMTYFSMYSYKFCWPVRTLRVQNQIDRWLSRTPAMVAGLTDHVWSFTEWLSYPTVQLT